MIAQLISIMVTILYIAIIARVILSWIPNSRSFFVTTIVTDLTEPILAPIRRFLPYMGGLDLSPFIAVILMNILQGVFF